MRSIADNAKEGIDVAESHEERLSRYLLYVQRLGVFLKKIPDIGDAISPLEDIKDEIDLLVHHHKSDLLRPVAAPRTSPANADQRLRMIAVLCYKLHRQVGLDEKQARAKVADLVRARGYRGAKGDFGPGELKNWVSKAESGEYPGVIATVDRMITILPSLRTASTGEEARGLSVEMLGRIRLPPLSRAQAEKQRPIV
ncbi:hypothetical protein [Sphingomonas glacialis]|uniref:Uncharacterized protein n=1 Tax=Sphingomonas glacialis TaxID=658225 RepID=A0A502G671_9SPHN|nr:hypothetical protein [Sphingomonas glacialis]TPG56373.1 hypothetical protein EAH76_02105 [Sphingomonas glacialis]